MAIVAIETAARLVGPDTEEATVIQSKAATLLSNAKRNPENNITSEERKALRALKDDENITILPADKGRATVVMDEAAYEEKMQVLLDDNTTYRKLASDPTNAFKNTTT